MKSLKSDLEAAKQTYERLAYDGDLARDLARQGRTMGRDRRSMRWVPLAAAAAFIAAAVVLTPSKPDAPDRSKPVAARTKRPALPLLRSRVAPTLSLRRIPSRHGVLLRTPSMGRMPSLRRAKTRSAPDQGVGRERRENVA